MHPTAPRIIPLAYHPDFETAEEGEEATGQALTETLRRIAATVYKDSGHAARGVHAKSHGLIRGQLQVAEGLAPEYAQGLFARAGDYPVVIRLSTTPGDMLDDNVSTPRGMAIKVVGVPGARGPGSFGDNTQDFVLVNGPVFAAPRAKPFLKNLKLLAPTTDKSPGLKKALSAVLRGAEKAIEALGGESGTLKSLGGHPETHILGETFFSQAPILYGPYMAKVCLAPVSASLLPLIHAPVDLKEKPDGLRQAVVEFFAAHEAVWELRVQLCTNIEAMPVEDSSVLWPEAQSPYVTVARITAVPQTAWSEARSRAVDDGMSFSPWHCLADHRPLGSIMRVRKQVYEMSAKFRAEHNGVRIEEPRDLDALPE